MSPQNVNDAATAGNTHDATLDGIGILLVPGSSRKHDITPFAPKTSQGNPRYQDFSLSQFWVLESFHHGRGALEWLDPFTYYDAAGLWTHVKGQVTLAGLQLLTTKAAAASIAGPPLVWCLVTTSATLFMATGGASRDVFQWDNTNGVWTAETAGLTADPTSMIEAGGVIYVAQGEGTVARRKRSGTWSDAAGSIQADVFAVFNNFTLYRAENQNEIYWTVDPGAATPTWSGPIYVGDNNTQVRGMAVYDSRLWVGKDDGLYYIQEQRAYQYADFSWGRDSNNFKRMREWQGALYFPILHGLYRLQGSTLQAMGPDLGQLDAADRSSSNKSLASAKRGRIVDIIPAGDLLYAVIDGADSGDTSQIVSYNGSGWNQMVQGIAATTRIRSAFITGRLATTGQFNSPRLWYGYGSDAYNVILPYGTNDPYEYALQTYHVGTTPTSDLVSPWFDAGLANVWKEFISMQVYSEGFTANETVQVAYEVDDVGSYQNLVTAAGVDYAFTVSPYQEIPMPQNTIGKKIRLRLRFVRGSTTTLTPKMKVAVVEYIPRPDTRFAWQCTMRAGRRMVNSYRQPPRIEPPDAGEWRQWLEDKRNSRQRVEWDDGEVEPGITNLVLNPHFAIDSNADGLADNWNLVLTPSVILTGQRKIHHNRSQRVSESGADQSGIASDSITVVVGTRYTASVYVYIPTTAVAGVIVTGSDGLVLQLRDGGGTIIASQVITSPLDRWVRVEVTGVAISTTVSIRVLLSVVATQTNAFFVAGAQLEITPDARFLSYAQKATSLCTGDMPRCRWTGRRHLSTSVRDSFYTVFVTNVQAVEVGKPSLADRLRGQGSEYRLTFSLAEVS